jgi:hypothetical protein
LPIRLPVIFSEGAVLACGSRAARHRGAQDDAVILDGVNPPGYSHGGAFCTDEYAGAALWLAPGVHPDEERLAELMESSASPAARDARPSIFEQMAKIPPEGAALVPAAHRRGPRASRQTLWRRALATGAV